LLGPIAGVSIVFAASFIFFFLADANVLSWMPTKPTIELDLFKATIEHVFMPIDLVWMPLLLAAFVVHLWLPLFALSVMLLRVLNYFRRAVGAVQWFLKRGREHPLDAIGSVAASLVLIATVVIQNIA
jgi:hypothetical protein